MPVFLEVLILAALLGVLGATGWRVAGRALPAEAWATRGSLAMLVATALATGPATVLGHFGNLRLAPFLVTVATVAAIVWLLSRGATRSSTAEPSVALPEPGRARPLATAAVVALIASAAFSIHQERYAPPGFHGLDDNSYHLATVATWRERGDLAGVKFAHGDRSTPYYPILGELVTWVLLAPLNDNDAFARWSQLPFFLASLVTIAALGRRLRLAPRWTLLAVLLYAGLERAFPTLALGAGNDHAATFFTLAGLDAVLLLAAAPCRGGGLHLGLSLGLLLGTKFLGLLFAPLVLGLGLVALALRGPAEWRSHAPRLLRAAAVAALVTLATGGYTYLRNAVTAGNPLYPVPIHLFGLDLPGTTGVTLAERRHLPPFAIDLPGFLFRENLFGALGRFVWVPAALLAPALALWYALRRRTERRRRLTEAAVWTLPLLFFLIFLYQIHDHRDSRYLFPALALAGLGAGWLIAEARTRGRFGSVLEGLFLAGTWLLAVSRHHDHPAAMGVVLVLSLGAGVLGWRFSVLGLARVPRLAALTSLVFLPGLVHAVAVYPERQLRHQTPSAKALELEIGAAGAGVAYVGYNYPFPFWGSRMQNRVMIVPRNFQHDARLYEWGGTASDFSYHPGKFEAWWRNLRALDVAYVVVVRTGDENPERAWMLARPERYERFYDDGSVELWRIRGAAPQSPSRYPKISGATIDASD